MGIWVLRLGHRIARDKRITTHVGLTARAFGADKIILSGEKDQKVLDTWTDITKRWGGPFEVEYKKSWRNIVKNFDGTIVHLTMYGHPYKEKMKEIKSKDDDILIILGGEKVPPEIYELSNYNIAIGNQPHSEVAALGVFLENYNGIRNKFENAEVELEPGKKSGKGI